MGTGPSSKNVLYQTEECVGEFIERFHKQKKERARDAKYRLMEQHLDMFPAYLDDLDEFCENHLFHRSIVYLTKLEKGKRWGRCMHCGREFLLDRSVKPGSEGTCPKCGFPIRFRGEWASKPIVEKAKICIPSRVDGQLLLRYTDVRRIISPDKREPEFDYSDFFLNIVEEKNGRQKAYAYWWRSYPYYWSGWRRHKNGSACYSDTYVYTENLPEVFGERYCHVDLQAGLKDLLRPINFAELGMNLSTAFNIFVRQSLREGRIPFDISLNQPNQETVAAMLEAERIAKDPSVKGYLHRGRQHTPATVSQRVTIGW